MLADILFILYLIFIVAVIIFCVHPKGIELQQEYMAWKITRDYFMSKRG